jgi:hypothetical protein
MKVAKQYLPYILLAASLTTLAIIRVAHGSVSAAVQRQADLEAIGRVLEQYRAIEELEI